MASTTRVWASLTRGNRAVIVRTANASTGASRFASSRRQPSFHPLQPTTRRPAIYHHVNLIRRPQRCFFSIPPYLQPAYGLWRHSSLMALLGIVLSVIAFDLYIHFERVPESAGDRWRFMPGSTQATVQQCLIKYQLDRRRYQDSLLGRDDPRWARAERVLQQLIVANGLEGCLQRDIISVEGNKWELMVIDVKGSRLFPSARMHH
jgi:hypothetical protein